MDTINVEYCSSLWMSWTVWVPMCVAFFLRVVSLRYYLDMGWGEEWERGWIGEYFKTELSLVTPSPGQSNAEASTWGDMWMVRMMESKSKRWSEMKKERKRERERIKTKHKWCGHVRQEMKAKTIIPAFFSHLHFHTIRALFLLPSCTETLSRTRFS